MCQGDERVQNDHLTVINASAARLWI